MIFDPNSSSIFGGAAGKIDAELKDPGLYREAVIYEKLSHMSHTQIKEFVSSSEAKIMLNEGIISADLLTKLNDERGDGHCCKATVCHMAKTNGDPLWDEFIETRNKEKDIMAAMMDKYVERAQPYVESAVTDVINRYLPNRFK